MHYAHPTGTLILRKNFKITLNMEMYEFFINSNCIYFFLFSETTDSQQFDTLLEMVASMSFNLIFFTIL